NASGVKDAANNLSSFAAIAPADGAAPARLTMVMNDTDANGKVDQVAMTLSEPLAAYSAGTSPWTLANAPSGATLGSVTASGTTATLSLAEGSGSASTAVGT